MSLQNNGAVTPPPRSAIGTGLLHGSSGRPRSSSPSDEAIWRRLKEAGFDEEMIRRRDKAALIAYISKLETELYDHQHHMGLLIIEKKEWMSKYEQIKSAADLAEITYKRDQAAHSSTVSEAKKREENLKKALDIERECTTNIEKALHELRAEYAETKISADCKLAEAQQLMLEAQQKSDEADSRSRISESLHAEARRVERNAARKLQDVEAREDDLRRRLLLLEAECDAEKKDLSLERQSIHDTQKLIQQEQAKLVERQSYLDRREEQIFSRSQDLDKREKELEIARKSIERETLSIKLEKSNLESNISALAIREKAITEKEAQLDQREMDLLSMQETIASKERDEIRRLKSEHESFLAKRNSNFEADLNRRLKSADDELNAKRQTIELREAEIDLRDKAIQERENAMEKQSKALLEKEEDFGKKLQTLSEKKECASLAQKAAEKERLELQKERDEIRLMCLDLEEAKKSIAEEKNKVILEQEKIGVTISERNELLVLESKLKEEIDSFRAKKMELITETDILREEREKFEKEWELVDLKKDHLEKEAERIAKENEAASQHLKNEHDSLKLEKDILRNQFKSDFESLSCEREEMIAKLEHEHSEWFSKIQHERDIFVEDLKIQKKEQVISIEKRQEEVEAYFREREEAFEKQKAQELQKINSQMDMIKKERDDIEVEKEKLNKERMGIIEDRAAREREWSEIRSFLDDLDIQRKRLQEQRELLIKEKEEIHANIQQLKELQDLNMASENRVLSEGKIHGKAPRKSHVTDGSSRQQTLVNTVHGSVRKSVRKSSTDASPPSSASFSWFRKYADVIFKRAPEETIDVNPGKNAQSAVPIQHGFLDSLEIEDPAKKGSISTSGVLVIEKPDLKKSSVAEFPSGSENPEREIIEEGTSYKDEGCTVHANIFSSQEFEEGKSRFLDHEFNSPSFGRKRPNDTSPPSGSISQFKSSENCQKRQRRENLSEQSPVGSLSEIINSSKCPEDRNDLIAMEKKF